LFNLQKHGNSEDKKEQEPTVETVENSGDQPAAPSPSPQNLVNETQSTAPDSFPNLAIPQEMPVLLPEPEIEPEPRSTSAAADSARPLYPPLPQKSPHKGALDYVFSAGTSSGRFIRSLLRWLAAIFGLFALGLLAGYLLLYQPTQNELDAAQVKLKQADQAVSQKDQSLQTAQSDRTQIQQSLQKIQADLNKASSENDILMVLVSVSNARVALVNKDGATAKTAIEQAQANLTKAQTYIESIDKTKFDVLKTRLDLTAKELVGDPQAAQTDLDKLAADLTDLRQKLFVN
jgi:hypothetical protein